MVKCITDPLFIVVLKTQKWLHDIDMTPFIHVSFPFSPLGEWFSGSAGTAFTPHVIIIRPDEVFHLFLIHISKFYS